MLEFLQVSREVWALPALFDEWNLRVQERQSEPRSPTPGPATAARCPRRRRRQQREAAADVGLKGPALARGAKVAYGCV